ncbi:MAG: ABC transporter ATP-binding protein [Aquificota bacterium]|nr:MAG: ABC transporter ATP-binding protein [Aquificota bacterium]
MATLAVEVAGLRKVYKKREAVRGISLTVEEGEIFGLIGPDGAGKSSVMKILAGVLSFNSGKVRVLGRDYPKGAEDVKKDLAFMPQGIGLNLYTDLSVWENIEFFAHLQGISPSTRDERARRLLKATGLAPFENRLVRHLSGGMQQKLGLCCALMSHPRLLILDEPTTGVDPLSRREFWDLLFDFVEEGMTVILSTSYMDEAERCHRMAFMIDGSIIFQGDPQELTGTSYHLEQAFFRILKEERPQTFHLALPSSLPSQKKDGVPAVVVKNLSKWFDSFRAVDSLSFTIEKREIFGLLGPNGAGKTTAIKSMVGLLEPTGGEIAIAGLNRRSQLGDIKRHIGYMSQKFSLYRDLTVSENMELYATLYGLSGRELKERKNWILKIADLAGQEKMLVRDIPLGVKQRLALGCSLLHFPRVLFLDEPTSGVDPQARKHFWEIITRLSQEKGLTFLVTTHHLVEAEYCHRLALMNQGRLVALGSPQELRERVIREKGEMLELLAQPQRKALKLIKSLGHQAYPLGRLLRLWGKGVPLDRLKKRLTEEGITLEIRGKAFISMEDVFIHFMEQNTHE